MSLKVVLPLATLVFGGSATVTTGVYFYSHGSGTGKGTGGDPKGPVIPPPKGDQKQKENSSDPSQHSPAGEQPKESPTGGGNIKDQSGNAGGDAPAQITDNTKRAQEQQSPENAGSSLPADNTTQSDKTNSDSEGTQLKVSQEESGTPVSKPEGPSSSLTGNVPQPSQDNSSPAGSPERDEKTTEQSESHETEDKKNQNADGAVVTGGDTKGPSSNDHNPAPKGSDSQKGSPSSGDSK